MYKSNVNFNLYKTFYDVAKCGSISKTATMNFTSQPAISRSIKTLEQELNTKLFYRTKKGIELTDKGRELLFYVEQSYNSLVTAERMMLETKTLDKGKLSIGIPSHIASFYLFDAIDSFHKEYPNIEITLIKFKRAIKRQVVFMHIVDIIIKTIISKNIWPGYLKPNVWIKKEIR